MGFYVPWVVDGSKHSARLFRRTLQQQIGSGSGVDRPGDLRVQALNVPGTGFRVAPGGGVAQSRDSSAASRESYGPILDSELVVSGVPGTGSSGGRRDLVILEITDPEMESVVYPAPSSPEGWQDGDNFVRVTVIPDVDSMVPAAQRPVKSLEQLTTGAYANVTGVTLAAINWPASTGTITPAMVEDLRQVQSPRTSTAIRSMNLTGSTTQFISATTPYPLGGQTWPAQAEDVGIEIDIPAWATVAKIESTIYQALVPAKGASHGDIWVQIAPTVHPHVIRTQSGRWDIDELSKPHRTTIGLSDTVKIPEQLRGTRQKFYPRANAVSGTGTGSGANTLGADWATSFNLTVVFEEVRD